MATSHLAILVGRLASIISRRLSNGLPLIYDFTMATFSSPVGIVKYLMLYLVIIESIYLIQLLVSSLTNTYLNKIVYDTVTYFTTTEKFLQTSQTII